MAGKRVVLGVGERARRYDLRFPRVRPVYVNTVEDAAVVASQVRVVGAVITGRAEEVVQAARVLRRAAPAAHVVAVGPSLRDVERELQGAGVLEVGSSWLVVVSSLAQAIKIGRAPAPVAELVAVMPRLLH